jgi:L-amino acid N-acyltransferase YncA
MPARIRLADESDARAIAEIYRPSVEAAAISFEVIAPDPEEMARRIAATTASLPWLVCEIDAAIAGYAYATQHRVRAAYRWSVDTSVYIAAAYRRRRVGAALYTSLLAILRAQGCFNAFAGITLPNPGSVGLHESVGFRPIGVYRHVGYKLGAWHDVGWWQLVLQPHASAPAEPLTLAAIQQRPDWPDLLRSGEQLVR